MRSFTATVTLVVMTSAALAQPGVPGWNIEVAQPILAPGMPETTIRISARFGFMDHAFGAAAFSVVATEPGWVSPRLILPPPGNAGTIQGERVTDIVLGQIHFPNFVIADPSNPIAVWEATWRSDDFHARIVQIQTVTTRFDVYTSPTGPQSQSRLAQLTEGSVQIFIVPAPGAASVLIAALGFALPRRRRIGA